MSDSDSDRPRPQRGLIGEGERITDPTELARLREVSRQFRKTAQYQIGPAVAEASPILLAQYIAVEMEEAERQEFLAELIQLLPDDVLRQLGDSLQARLGRGAA